ncbi:MAG: DUF3375 domain-containing protein [Microthrixaceae bacterium]|nr:DUF3375 domain-containing protein [Microthrixaceae bacterium]
MDFDEIEHLKARHGAWSLLRADNVALVLSFLSRVFLDANQANLPASKVLSELDDELYALNQRIGESRFPKSAKAYLDDWSASERGWLRRHVPAGADEPHYDLTPSVERAVAWVEGLRSRSFVGTESRLGIVVELLRQLIYGAAEDSSERLADLRRRRDEIDATIAQLEAGELGVDDPVVQRDRYQQFSRTARELLGDFREVEENFRELDRDLRAKIAGWTGSKGELLDDVVSTRSGIADSDQGRSFAAFYDLLLSGERQQELADLLARLRDLDDIPEFDPRLERIQRDWLDASERTQATIRQLSEQLRRFLDDQVWLENRRVFDLLRSIEANALAVRDVAVVDVHTEVDDTRVSLRLPMERPLYQKVRTTSLQNSTIEIGTGDVDSKLLADHPFIDTVLLTQRVLASLGAGEQVGLNQVIDETPLDEGLAEVIAYLTLADESLDVDISEQDRTELSWTESTWPHGVAPDADDVEDAEDVEDVDEVVLRVLDLPAVTFKRTPGGPS